MEAPLPSEIRLAAAMVKHFGDPEADAHLRRPEIWTSALLESFRGEAQAGDCLPWSKTHEKVRLRRGEVSLWPGINGHGKTVLTSQVVGNLLRQGRRVAVASLEMKPWMTLKRMARQAAGNSSPADKFLLDFVNWLGKRRFLLFDQRGRADWKFITKVVRYAAAELHVEHFFLDSLMMLVAGEDDYNSQKDCITELCSAAHDTGVHVHVIHHARKLRDEKDIPGKFDVKGTGAITDQVDNVFVIWRNKVKEVERANAQRIGGDFDEAAEPDALLVCDKQRNGEWEGRIRLWYDAPSMTYRGMAQQPRFLGYDLAELGSLREPGADEDEREEST